MTDRIREIARSWLEEGRVEAFVGFRRREDGSVVPVSIRDASEADRLVFDDACIHNLMSYVDLKGDERLGILLKGCDGRALVQLLAEGEIDRERISVVGVVCPGLRGNGSEDGGLAAKCVTCRVNTPPVYDELVEPEGAEPWDRDATLDALARIEAMSYEERAAYFKTEFDKCIRCYACRDICPLCYCEECVTEKTTPQWVEVSIKPSSNFYWHLIRAYHLAGRCVECGECDRACPVGIPLGLLNQKLATDVERLFEYRAGTDPQATPALQEFREDEEHVLGHGEAS